MKTLEAMNGTHRNYVLQEVYFEMFGWKYQIFSNVDILSKFDDDLLAIIVTIIHWNFDHHGSLCCRIFYENLLLYNKIYRSSTLLQWTYV